MIDLTLTLESSSPLHVGGEVRQNTTASRPMLKTHTGMPYVPAPSIKGRLRHATASFLRDQNQRVCNAPLPEHMCQSLNDDVNDYCAVCRLFGAPWLESSLIFSRLQISEQQQADFLDNGTNIPPTISRVGIRLNHTRRTVQEHFLFDTELFEPGFAWKYTGTVTYTQNEVLNLAPILLASRLVTMIGGNRSRGLGWCRLDVEVNDMQVDLTDLWEQWILLYGS